MCLEMNAGWRISETVMPCQGKFGLFFFTLDRSPRTPPRCPQPVKRRRALLASNPLRNNRSEARRKDPRGAMKLSPPLPSLR